MLSKILLTLPKTILIIEFPWNVISEPPITFHLFYALKFPRVINIDPRLIGGSEYDSLIR